jgi:hypothetical protein
MNDFDKKIRRPLGNVNHIEPVEVGCCRDENCERLDVHEPGAGRCMKRWGREILYRTRSRRFHDEPWRAHHFGALRESVYNATSTVQPRTFSLILGIVENDYGSCCPRSLHRHLASLRSGGSVIRMDFTGRLHAYLRAGSKLVDEPDLVLEQIIDLHAERSGSVERAA